MSNQFTDTAAWSDFVQTAYDRQAAYSLRDRPMWRQMIDKRPEQQAMPGDVVVLSVHGEMDLATTPLDEAVDPDAVAMPDPTQVSVTIHEYGNATLRTLRLQKLSFNKPDPEIARLVGFNMADSVDKIVRTVADGGTRVIGTNGGTLVTSTFAADSVVATDIMSRKVAVVSMKLLQRKKVIPKQGGMYVAIINPDVSYDLQAETGATAWISPHTDGTDTRNVYTGMIGDFMGGRFVETTRTTVTDNTDSIPVYNTYFFGREAIVEAPVVEPHIVLGPQVDSLRRFYPLGWHAMFGHSIYRNDSLVIAKTASSIGDL